MLYKLISILTVFILTTMNQLKAQTNEELSTILSYTPDIKEGEQLFDICSKCHGVEGWGSYDGDFPQLAGQHKAVIIKQLLDIRSGKRENPIMRPVIMTLSSYSEHAIANVAAYIETLKMDPEPAVGETDDQALEIAGINYKNRCASCHGANGEGKAEKFYPLLQGQNYEYLLRQLKHIQSGQRKNSNRQMQKVISQMSTSELEHLADYISRLEPPEYKVAPMM